MPLASRPSAFFRDRSTLMHATTHEDRTLTELDHVRILKLLQRTGAPGPAAGPATLATLLDEADVVPSREVPADVVTMYSRVTLEDTDTREHRTLCVCYPPDADPVQGFVSILSPMGAALLGRRVGDVIAPASGAPAGGAAARLRIVEILFQPEASGDYTL